MCKFYKRFIKKSSITLIDDDELVDYDVNSTNKLSSIKKKFKEFYEEDEETIDYNYKLEYDEKGLIKQPQFFVESTGEVYYLPITMNVIRSIILKQHCKITKPEELMWFEDGLKWLSQQQYQNKNYYEKHKIAQYDIEDLERSCDAYFGIPLHLCENSWAAKYLINHASKGNIFRRMRLLKSNTIKSNLKKLLCIS